MGKNCKKDNKYKLAKVGKYVGSILFASVMFLGVSLTTQTKEVQAAKTAAVATSQTDSSNASSVSSANGKPASSNASTAVSDSSSNTSSTEKSAVTVDNSSKAVATSAVQTKQSAAVTAESPTPVAATSSSSSSERNAKVVMAANSATDSKGETGHIYTSGSATVANNDDGILAGSVNVKGVNKTTFNNAMKSLDNDLSQIKGENISIGLLSDYNTKISTLLGKATVMDRTVDISQAEINTITNELQQLNTDYQKHMLDTSKLKAAFGKVPSENLDDSTIENEGGNVYSYIQRYTTASYTNLENVISTIEGGSYNTQADVNSATAKLNAAIDGLVSLNKRVDISEKDPTQNDDIVDKNSAVQQALKILNYKINYDRAVSEVVIDQTKTKQSDIDLYTNNTFAEDYDNKYTTSPDKVIASAKQLIAVFNRIKFLNTDKWNELASETITDIMQKTDKLYQDTYKEYIALEQAVEGKFPGLVGGPGGLDYFDAQAYDIYGKQSKATATQAQVDTWTANLQQAITNYQQAVANHNKKTPTNQNNQTNKNGQVNENGHWYLYQNGVKQTGLQAIPEQHKTVYYNNQGQMQYGQQQVSGHWYLFDKV
ncbi:MAG: hypothetical protein ABF539_06815, partial [Liquorilactobacillus nagelii]